jgi:chromosome segregation ATPase
MLSCMTQPPDLEARVAALETKVSDLDQRVRHSVQDAAAARVLAGAADRDVSEMRAEIRDFRDANNRTLNALRQDMVDLRQDINQRFARVDERFARVDDGFTEMRGKFDGVAAGLQQITGMLSTLTAQDSGQSGGE